MEFASKTFATFDPDPTSVPVTATGADAYKTPDEWAITLSDLAMLRHVRADLSAAVRLSAADTCTLTVRLTDGATTYASAQAVISSGTRADIRLTDIDIQNVAGGTKLRLALDVDSAGASANARLFDRLDITTPLVLA